MNRAPSVVFRVTVATPLMELTNNGAETTIKLIDEPVAINHPDLYRRDGAALIYRRKI